MSADNYYVIIPVRMESGDTRYYVTMEFASNDEGRLGPYYPDLETDPWFLGVEEANAYVSSEYSEYGSTFGFSLGEAQVKRLHEVEDELEMLGDYIYYGVRE